MGRVGGFFYIYFLFGLFWFLVFKAAAACFHLINSGKKGCSASEAP